MGKGSNNAQINYQREAADRAYAYDQNVYEHQWGLGYARGGVNYGYKPLEGLQIEAGALDKDGAAKYASRADFVKQWTNPTKAAWDYQQQMLRSAGVNTWSGSGGGRDPETGALWGLGRIKYSDGSLEDYGTWQSRINYAMRRYAFNVPATDDKAEHFGGVIDLTGQEYRTDENTVKGVSGKTVKAYHHLTEYEKEGEIWKQFNQQADKLERDKAAAKAQREYQDKTNRQSWQYQTDVNNQLYQNQLRAYGVSENAYLAQKRLNDRVYGLATRREQEVYDEGIAQQGFENERVLQELLEITGSLGYEKKKLSDALGISQTEFNDQKAQLAAKYTLDVASGKLDQNQTTLNLDNALDQLDDNIAQAERRKLSATNKEGLDTQFTQLGFQQNQADTQFDKSRQSLTIAGRERLAELDLNQALLIQDDATRRATLEKQAADLNYNKAETEAYIARKENEFKLKDAKNQATIDKELLGLNLSDTERAGYIQRRKVELDFDDAARQSALSERKAQLDLTNLGGALGYKGEKSRRDYLEKESASKYEQATVGLELQQAKQRSDYERDVLNRELLELKANNAIELSNLQVQALKQAGQAALGQSGRSQSKAIMGFAAAIGRQQAALVSSITRAESMTDAKIRQSRQGKLSAIQQAAIKEQKISEDRLNSLATLTADLGEVGRELAIGTQQTGLEIESIQSNLATTRERTDIEIENIQGSLSNALKKTNLQKSDIDNILQTTKDLSGLSIEEINKSLSQALAEKGLRKSEIDSILKTATSRYDIDKGRISSEIDTAKSLAGLTIDKLTADLGRQTTKKGLDLKRITQEAADEKYLAELQKSGFIDQKGYQKDSAQIELERIMSKSGYTTSQYGLEKQQIENRKLGEILKTTTGKDYLDDQLGWAQTRKDLDTRIGVANKAGLLTTKTSNLEDLLIQKDAGDQRALYNKMLSPTRPVDLPQPDALPVETWGKLLSPTPAPAPILGAKMSYDSVGALDVIGGVASGAMTGISAYSALTSKAVGLQAGTAGAVAWPLGIGLALYSIFG